MPTVTIDARPATTAAPAGGESVNKVWLRALKLTAGIAAAPERTLPRTVEEQAQARPDAPALLGLDARLNFRELACAMRRYARWALAQDLAKGDVVTLMAPNHPNYMAVWLGLTSVGVIVALINSSLRGEALAHCLAAAAPKRLIAADEFAGAAAEAAARLADPPEIWLLGEGEGRRLEAALAALPSEPLTAAERRAVTVNDGALLIYTSGSTGLPKAARVSHHRVMSWSLWFAGMLGVTPKDRLYDCLPMHHSVGGVVATGALLVSGGSVAIADKFSASRFWDEVTRWDCTLFQYIGELCRYLVAAQPNANERRHRLRAACGNGMSKPVWTAFQERFAIPRIIEFYAATEGNFSLFNVEGEPGAIGRAPAFMAHRFPAALVAFDPETGAPVRDAQGRCIRCARGETGEAIGRIAEPGGDPAHRFEGYTDAEATEKKVLRDVFEPGDAWVRTGDLMRLDQRGFFYFVDRVGDTFRWKGENVSAAEVGAAIDACPGVQASAVYGVKVPGAEGRAGMAAIVAGPGFDLAQLRARLSQALPPYARPLFIRLTPALSMTETFKKASHRLAAEGFDPARVRDPLFLDDPAEGRYTPVDAALFARLGRGEVRL
jgi:fatty-acyl-CoA synthase